MTSTQVVAIHAGAGSRDGDLAELAPDIREALGEAIGIARAVLEGGGHALDAVESAIAFMESEVPFFNAGRGSALCEDGSVELGASLMRGSDRAAGAVAAINRAKHPIAAARIVLESPQVLMVGPAADARAAAAGAELADPSWFVTDRQRERLRQTSAVTDHGTVGAVCLDAGGVLAAGTSTGGVRGQPPGRVGDSPLIGAGTWADRHVAVSCTGAGEAFVRSGTAREVAALVESGRELDAAAEAALDHVRAVGGLGGLIALDSRGALSMPFTAEVMPRASWRAGEQATILD